MIRPFKKSLVMLGVMTMGLCTCNIRKRTPWVVAADGSFVDEASTARNHDASNESFDDARNVRKHTLETVASDNSTEISDDASHVRKRTSGIVAADGSIEISDEARHVRKHSSGTVAADGSIGIEISEALIDSTAHRMHTFFANVAADSSVDISDGAIDSMTSYSKQYTSASNVLLQCVLLLAFLFFSLATVAAVARLVDTFDVEIPDDQGGGAHLYKWVSEAPDPDVGVEAVAGSHVFLDYCHIDIELTSEAITELLTAHGCLQHVKPYIPDILWDCIRTSSRFMISKDKNNILLIRDSVLVRFSCNSHLLVERAQGREDEKAHYAMPTLHKIGAESPQKAAERWCARSLDFLKKKVRFIESDEETHHVDAYEGLRVVERKFVVIVQLIQNTPEMPSLPDNQHFLWMPLGEIESHPLIPKHIALAEVNLWVGGKLHSEADLCELEDFLSSNAVDTTAWTGTDGTNTSENLLREINLGQCILKLEEDTVERVINLIALRLRVCGADDILLVEVGRREYNGAIKWRMQVPGTKQKVGETIEAAAHRTCIKQLRLSEEDFDIAPETSRECIKYASPSKTYPGIMTAYYMYLVNVDLSDEAPLAPNSNSWMIRAFRKLERVSPRKIGTLWGE